MADICIIYASEDRAIAEKLYGLLSQQWDTWWDDKIVGRFPRIIETEIQKSSCIVPLFSACSVEKNTVRDELKLGEKYGKEILPIELDDSDAPFGFSDYTRVAMHGWEGEIDHSGFKQLQRKLAGIVLPKDKPKRPDVIANGRLPLPALFHSVSSFDTQLVPSDAVKALKVFGTTTVLVSAYDLVVRRDSNGLIIRNPKRLIIELKKFRKQGGFVLVDSGNYEASRLTDETWCPDNLKEALSHEHHDWVFTFDVMNPSKGPKQCVEQLVEAVKRDQEFTSAPVLPIIHASKLRKVGYKLDDIPQIIREVSERLEPPLIAIPERELGAGLIARAITVKAIRQELNKLPFYQPLHLLGTGNPWSIPILAAAGADTFDGLEWCRMAVDRNNNRLNHFQHFDFFAYQAGVADSLVTREALENPEIDFAGKVAFHNLDYYAGFVEEMRKHVREGNLEAFVVELTGLATVNQLKKGVPGLFK